VAAAVPQPEEPMAVVVVVKAMLAAAHMVRAVLEQSA